jgi:hypothetical protein
VCPARQDAAAQQAIAQVKNDYPDSTVTVVLPRRMHSPPAADCCTIGPLT